MQLAILFLFVLATLIAQFEARPYDENDPQIPGCRGKHCQTGPLGDKRDAIIIDDEHEYDENDPRMLMIKKGCKKCSRGSCKPVPNCRGKREFLEMQERNCKGKHCQTGPLGDKRDSIIIDDEHEYDENDPRMLMIKKGCKKCSRGSCKPVPNCRGKREFLEMQERNCKGKHCQTGPLGDKRDSIIIDNEKEYDENDPRMLMIKKGCKKCSRGSCKPVPNCRGKREFLEMQERNCKGKHCQTGPLGDK